MKPVNFIEVKKESKNRDRTNIVLLLLPLCLLVGFIVFDIFVNFSDKTNKSSELVSIEEANILEEKIKSFNIANKENNFKIDFYKELDNIKDLDRKLLKSLEVFSSQTDNNIFINSFSSNGQEIIVNGISLNSDLLDDLNYKIERDLDNFVLNEVNFEDGYYKFSYKGELK